jgi:hypothetical protein
VVLNGRRAVTGCILFCGLTALVILILAFAHTWSPRIEAQRPHCFPDFLHAKSPLWLGCVMAAHEALAGGLIAAAGALFGAWLAFSGLQEQIAAERQNTRTLQRAYVNVEPLGIAPLHSGTNVVDNVVAHVQCRNVGHLPAKDCQFSLIKMKWVPDDLIEQEMPTEVEVLEFKQVLPVQAYLTVGTSDRLRYEDYLQVASGKGYLLVWGKMTYLDGFDTARFVTFCHRYPCVSRTGNDSSGYSIAAKYARYHHYGNDAN